MPRGKLAAPGAENTKWMELSLSQGCLALGCSLALERQANLVINFRPSDGLEWRLPISISLPPLTRHGSIHAHPFLPFNTPSALPPPLPANMNATQSSPSPDPSPPTTQRRARGGSTPTSRQNSESTVTQPQPAQPPQSASNPNNNNIWDSAWAAINQVSSTHTVILLLSHPN